MIPVDPVGPAEVGTEEAVVRELVLRLSSDIEDEEATLVHDGVVLSEVSWLPWGWPGTVTVPSERLSLSYRKEGGEGEKEERKRRERERGEREKKKEEEGERGGRRRGGRGRKERKEGGGE